MSIDEQRPNTPAANKGEVDAAQDEAGDDVAPRITLDHYFSRRKTSRVSWGHLIALVGMLVALVLILLLKERCADSVSTFIEALSTAPDR